MTTIRWAHALVFIAMFSGIFSAPTLAAAIDNSCENGCEDTLLDRDGDGLNECIERCLGTDDSNVDTDGDGMSDGFEYEFGLDARVDDSQDDLDGDAMTNVEEFLADSNPRDSFSPHVVYFVDPAGNDIAGAGSAETPWQTIGFALESLTTSEALPARVIIGTGTYDEDVALPAGVTVIAARGASVTIVGQMLGAEGATLKHVTLTPGADDQYLLDMNDVAMTLNHVVFQGTENRDRTGILMDGAAPSRGIIDQCTFTRLGVGLDIGGGIPTLRRNVFDNFPVTFGPDDLVSAAIYIRENGTAEAGSRNIGELTNPNNGWNDFLPTIEGFAVINEREEAVTMQNNYWGVTDPALFPTRVNGAADVLPILVQSSSVLASTIFCTVWDETDQSRIKSAALELHVSPFGSVVENTDGVYAFLCIEDGRYQVEIAALGYETHSAEVLVGSGEVKAINVAMRPTSTPVLSSENALFSGCNVTKETLAAGALEQRGDFLLMAVSVLTLLGFGRLRSNL